MSAKQGAVLLRSNIGQEAYKCPNELHDPKGQDRKGAETELEESFLHPSMIFNAGCEDKFSLLLDKFAAFRIELTIAELRQLAGRFKNSAKASPLWFLARRVVQLIVLIFKGICNGK
jgi:hypothetical protein